MSPDETPPISPQLIAEVRRSLDKSRAEFADLLGVSADAVQRYEEGSLHPSPQVLRVLTLMLASDRVTTDQCTASCWEIRRCRDTARQTCPAYKLNQGRMCWLLTGSFCAGDPVPTLGAARRACENCAVLRVVSGDKPARLAIPAEPRGDILCGMPRPARALCKS